MVYELWFRSARDPSDFASFPCDERGRVDAREVEASGRRAEFARWVGLEAEARAVRGSDAPLSRDNPANRGQ